MEELNQMDQERSSRPSKLKKEILRLLKIIGFVLLLPVMLAISLQIPFIQNTVSKYIVKKLSEKTDTHIEIGKVKLNVFLGLELDRFYAGNPEHTDTLIYVNRVSISLSKSLFTLYRGKLYVSEFIIDGTVLNIERQSGHLKNNLVLFIEKLTKSEPKEKKSSSLIEFKLDALGLKNVEVFYEDYEKGLFVKGFLKDAWVVINQLDFAENIVDISFFRAENPSISIRKEVKQDKLIHDSLTFDSEEKDTVESGGLYLHVGKIRIDDGHFTFSNPSNANPLPSSFMDYGQFTLNQLKLHLDSLDVNHGSITSSGLVLSFKDEKDFILENLSSTGVIINNESIELPSFTFKTARSDVSSDVQFLFESLEDLVDFERKVFLNAGFDNSSLYIRDIMHFVPGLANNAFFLYNTDKVVNLSGNVRGTVDNLIGQNVQLRIDNRFLFDGNFGTINLTQADNTVLNLKVDRLRSSIRFLRELIPGFQPPDNFYKLGNFRFDGRFDGFFKDFVASGNLTSELGRANLDMRLDVKQGNENAKYSGEISLVGFDLGKWSENPDIKTVSFQAKVLDGRGLTLDNAYANLSADLELFSFKSYDYKGMSLNGILEENRFNGSFRSDDENLKLDFKGEVSYIDSILLAEVKASIDNIDLEALHLHQKPLRFQGKIDANLKGKLPEELVGFAKVEGLKIYADTLHNLDSIAIYTYTLSGNESYLELISDFGEIRLEGIYNLPTIIPQFTYLLKDNYPYHTRNWEWPRIVTFDNNFEINCEIFNSKSLLRLAGINDLSLKNVRVKAKLNALNDEIGINAQIEELDYKNNSFFQVDINAESVRSSGYFNIAIDSTMALGHHFYPLSFETEFDRDTINFRFYTDRMFATMDTFDLGGSLMPHTQGYLVNIQDKKWKMLGEDWNIYTDNELVFGENFIRINDLLISDGYREIELADINNKGISLNLRRFDFILISQIINYDKIEFSGEGDTRVRIENLLGGTANISANIIVEDFRLNDIPYGMLEANIDMPPDESMKALLSLSKDAQTIKTNLIYDQKSGEVSGNLRARNFPLKFFEFIITDGISDTKGLASVDAEISGLSSDIKINGEATLNDGGVKIDYLGASFFFDKQKMKISERFLDLTGARITDIEGNLGTLRGGLRHHLFADFSLDISMSSERAVIINTTKFDNPIYYGYGKGRIDVAFSGTFESANINVNAVAGAGTVINIPVANTETGYEESFIKFISKEELLGMQKANGQTSFKIEGLNLDMNLTVTEDAQINIIFNERLGDVVKGRGRGNLQLIFRRTGEFEVYGDYEVDQGEYLFTAWNIAAKPFIVRRGGKIRWTGDPINAELNIKADYQVRAPLSLFLDEFLATSPGTIAYQEARNRQDITLILDLGGTLFSPNVKFDIEFPGLTGELISFAQSILRTLRSNEVALNSQVLGLLVFNTFLPNNNPISSNIFGSTQVVEAGISTLSEFVSSQLSQLLTGLLQEALAENGLIAGIDFEIGLRKNSAFFSDQTTADIYPDEIEVHLKNRFRFLDERLSLGAGVNYVRQSPLLLATDYYIPDFVVEYFLTDDRRLKLRFYGRYDIDEISQQAGRRQRYGLGIGYRREFGSLTDFRADFNRTARAIQEVDQ